MTQYRIRNWRRELLTEGRQVMGRDLPGGGGKWRRLVECPIDEAGLHLRDEEMVSLHRLMLDRKMEESPGMVFVLLEALPWAAIWTEKAGRQDGAIETLVLGDQSPRVVSPALQEQAKKQRWAAILIGVAIVVALLVIVLLVL